ncbi:MAG: polyphosphate polymerase domain-containing protein [Clostridia bacterium]|nr:polyphosphate polymerase domain-containing protein [Clostridia bacterium]
MSAYRHELKYHISYGQMQILTRRLASVMQPDAFARADGTYLIRSLYFDNLQDRALKEKVYGTSRREKFRIRYYNLDPTFIRLEKKSKINRLTSKESTPLTAAQCEQILRGDIPSLAGEASPNLLNEFYAKTQLYSLIPKAVVDYTRRTFVYPVSDTRITLDYHIRTGMRVVDFLNPALPTVPCDAAEDAPICILEVKYNEFLPLHIAALLQTDDIRIAPFSKYEVSRRYD